jgi:molecular chaperone GrpE
MDEEKLEVGRVEETMVEDIDSLKEALEEAKSKAETYLANWQRTEATLINYKKQMEKEREEFIKFANKSLISSLLPILDDFELALKSLPEKLAGASWVEGISLIYHKLKSVLAAQGLVEIDAQGEDFNPSIHEAVTMVEGEEGKVVDEIRKGYQLHQRLLRPALVAVGKSTEAEEE